MKKDAESSYPLVSVIMPTFNRVTLLRRSILSVLAQTYQNLEVFVINDASTDNTAEMLALIKDPRLKVIHCETSRGAAAARNAGIGAARGELFAFQDDDDYWLVQKLEKQVRALQSVPAEVGWCLGGFISISESHCCYVGGDSYVKEVDYLKGTGVGGPDYSIVATPNWLVRRDALERAGLFDVRLRSWDDWELGLRLDQVTDRIHVNEPLFIQRHAGGMMQQERARAADMRIIMEKHGGLWAGKRRVLARHYYCIGRGESLYDVAPAGRDALFQSLRLWPFLPKTWAALAMSFLGQGVAHKLTSRFRKMRGA
jgi:glycosyltransferase involved in cell wall biosynthesis